MVRHYKPRPKRRDPDKRMLRAVELRAEGLNNCQIAQRLLCSEGTVRNDLKRWAAQSENVTAITRKTSSQNVAPGATDYEANYEAADPNVISLSDRRKRA